MTMTISRAAMLEFENVAGSAEAEQDAYKAIWSVLDRCTVIEPTAATDNIREHVRPGETKAILDLWAGIPLAEIEQARDAWCAPAASAEAQTFGTFGHIGADKSPLTHAVARAASAEAQTACPIDRETLGKLVRMEWMAWAKEQPAPKSSWLVPWEGLSEPDREVDRRIGERIAKETERALNSTTPALREVTDAIDIFSLAEKCGAQFENEEPSSMNSPGTPATFLFTDRQLDEFAYALRAPLSTAQGVPDGWNIQELGDGFVHVEAPDGRAVNIGYAPDGDRMASALLRDLAIAVLPKADEEEE